MNDTKTAAAVLTIDCGACRAIRAAQDMVLTVRAGRAWVTVERDAADYWLAAGDALPLQAGERAWVGGWDGAVCCEVAPHGGPPCAGRRTIAARITRWMTALPRRAWS